jgi:hypothetical protein
VRSDREIRFDAQLERGLALLVEACANGANANSASGGPRHIASASRSIAPARPASPAANSPRASRTIAWNRSASSSPGAIRSR